MTDKITSAVFLIVFFSVGYLLGAEPDDKDLTILRLQKIIAEQSMTQLLEIERVKEYERIRANYQKLLAEIAAKEKMDKEKK